MKIKKIFLISCLILMSILLTTKSYCTIDTSIKMEIKDGTTAWDNISASDCYDECQYLNDDTSSLGTTNLQAHLSTLKDWNAMTIFSIGQYGGITSNSQSTNNNESGVFNIDKYNYTAGLIENSSRGDCFASIYDNQQTKYVDLYKANLGDNNYIWLNNIWWQGYGVISTTRLNIQNAYIGNGIGNRGGSGSNWTFRPVLWN